MDHNDENATAVVRLDEVKTEFEDIKRDMHEIKSEMEANAEKTGLAIEERGDDLKKALTAVEDISERLERVQKSQQEIEFMSSFGNTSAELKGALDEFGTGFMEFDGDRQARELPEGTKPNIKHLCEGVFTKSYGVSEDGTFGFYAPRHHAIARLQKSWDDVYVVDAMMRAQMDSGQLEEYKQNGGARSLKTYKRFLAVSSQFEKAAGNLIDRSTEVANWIPTQYSPNLYEAVKLGLPLLNMFMEIPMQAGTVVLPVDMNDHEGTRVTEITTLTSGDPWDDTTFVNPSALSSNKVTLTAEKIRSRYWISMEATEDAIVAMLPLLDRKHRRNLGEAIEDAIYNGQVTGDLDTAGTHFSKNNPVSSYTTDARYCWDGLRYFASAYTSSPSTSADQSNAKPTVTALRGLRAAMGEYGADPGALAYILGPAGYIMLLDDTSVATIDKFGPQATVRTGALAKVDGTDVVISRRVPKNANASGVIDNSTTDRTMATCVHTDGCILGNRRRVTLASQQWVSSDTTELVAFWRGDFQAMYAVASVPFVGHLYNVATS